MGSKVKAASEEGDPCAGERVFRFSLNCREPAVCFAMSLGLVEVWLMNVTAYPSFNSLFPLARDMATAFGGLASLGFAWLALYRPQPLMSLPALVTGSTLCVLASAGMFLASSLSDAALASFFASLRSLSACFYRACLCFSLMSVRTDRRIVVLMSAYLLKYLWMGLLLLAPESVRAIAFVVDMCVVMAILIPLARSEAARVGATDAPADLSVTNPLSFLPFTSKTFVAILLFNAALGFAITYGSVDGYPQSTSLAFVALALVAVVSLVRRTSSPDTFYSVAFSLVLAGLLLVLGTSGASGTVGSGALAGSVSNVLLQAGSEVIGIAVWLMVASLGERNPVGALPMVLMVCAANSFGTELGAASGHLQNYLDGARPDLAVLFTAAIALIFAVYNFLLARTFSFDETIRGVRPVEPVPQMDEDDSKAPDIDRICEELSAAHGLTARESQVLALLARGRNAAHIQESLTISRNTVKSYVARVYGKLEVHSHQEVIDLVERVGGLNGDNAGERVDDVA